jgi:hypothetical protein
MGEVTREKRYASHHTYTKARNDQLPKLGSVVSLSQMAQVKSLAEVPQKYWPKIPYGTKIFYITSKMIIRSGNMGGLLKDGTGFGVNWQYDTGLKSGSGTTWLKYSDLAHIFVKKSESTAIKTEMGKDNMLKLRDYVTELCKQLAEQKKIIDSHEARIVSLEKRFKK